MLIDCVVLETLEHSASALFSNLIMDTVNFGYNDIG